MTLHDLQTARARFALGYVVTSQGCWEWMGRMNPKGNRGQFRLSKRKIMAYRAGYILAGNDLDNEITLDHLCTNPGCVNPAHMEPCSFTKNKWRDKHLTKPVVLRGAA